jgi:hypothetical protein
MTVANAFVVDILSAQYRFVPPLQLPTDVACVEAAARPPFLRLLRLAQLDDALFTSSLGKITYDFIHALASPNTAPNPLLWDLQRGNRKALTFTSRLHCIRPLPSGLFVFDFGPNSTVPWKIAVKTAVDTLHVCRLDQGLSDVEITWHLVQQGVTFRMLIPLRPIPRPTMPTPALIPIRLSGYTFTKRDYDAYLH